MSYRQKRGYPSGPIYPIRFENSNAKSLHSVFWIENFSHIEMIQGPELGCMQSSIAIAFLTCDRRPIDYINSTLDSYRSSFTTIDAETAHLLIDGTDPSFVDQAHLPNVKLHPLSEGEYNETRSWDTHRRISSNYIRAFRLPRDNEQGVLICEDDIVFRRDFSTKLFQAVEELKQHGKDNALLTLYSSRDFFNDRSLDIGRFFGIYPPRLFFGGQAVYFPKSILALAEDFWTTTNISLRDNKVRPNDLLIRCFGEYLREKFGNSGGLFRCYFDLVNHVGFQSKTGLGEGFHSSFTFSMPWPE